MIKFLKYLVAVLLWSSCSFVVAEEQLVAEKDLVVDKQATPQSDSLFGQNESVGKFAKLADLDMYYEVYGTGQPLLLIHGNGGSIADMKFQIEYFSKHYQVIVADSRGHGKSSKGKQRLSYRLMAADWARLVEHLSLKNAHVLGWSDGGILGLILAIEHAEKVDKIAIMGANLQPDRSAVYQWAIDWVSNEKQQVEQKIKNADQTKDWDLYHQQLTLLGTQPDIKLSELKTIKSPVLVMAGDKDIIREEHTVLMYQNIPNAQLAIFPGETHWAPVNDLERFNQTVSRFFATPFSRPQSKDMFYPPSGN